MNHASLSRRAAHCLCAALLVFVVVSSAGAEQLVAHTVSLADSRTFTLNLPAALTIDVAVQGLRRVRFFAVSPDHRIFVTDMYNRADNSLGKVYILDGWNDRTHTFARTIPYLDHLRNPNNVAFY